MIAPPIIIGHSFGGLFTQLLLDRGLGAAGVAIDPAPPKGVFPTPAAVNANLGPLTARFSGKNIVYMSEKDFGRYFANGIPEAGWAQADQTYVIPTPVRIFIQSALAPFHNATALDYRKATRSGYSRAARAARPLLVGNGNGAALEQSIAASPGRSASRGLEPSAEPRGGKPKANAIP